MNAFGVTDTGKVRAVNQDAFRIEFDSEAKRAILVLCDGMGGENAGEVASTEASESFLRYVSERIETKSIPTSELSREAAAYSNTRVYDRAVREDDCRGMGTTLVAAVIRGEEASVVNVGDSRCYWMSGGEIQQVTRDHSLVQEMVERGLITSEEARSHPRKNIITRAVGSEPRIRSDVFHLLLSEGDKLLLCSDGLSNVVTEEELASLLREREELPACAEALLSLALERGAPDNVTVVLFAF